MPLVINSVTSSDSQNLLSQLVDEGADFNMTDYRGRGPIHIAAINGNYTTVEFLADNGHVNLDLMDRDGKTALYYACVMKHCRIANLLMQKGATVQVKASKLVQILCEAAFENDIDIVRLFCKAEVDLNQVNFDGRNVGHVAAHEGRLEILTFLAQSKRYNFFIKDRWGKQAFDLIRWSDKFEDGDKEGLLAKIKK